MKTSLLSAAQTLSERVNRMTFASPVTHVYNPLTYAWAAHALYLTRYGAAPKKVIFVGMNPGPFGMVQTGVPFGEINAVRDWMKIDVSVEKPAQENPKRPIEGFACTRSEVSGRRLWGLFAERFQTPTRFFADHFVLNYCPLAFFDQARNLTPDKLPMSEQTPLLAACDDHLRANVALLTPDWVIGIGAWAEKRIRVALAESPSAAQVNVGKILHPSPASPAANRGWAEAATKQLVEMGVW
jgi:single-strand selective monofunctional uracil DNA glycosylase